MDNKTKTLLIGAARVRPLDWQAHFYFTRRAEETGTDITVSAGDGMRLGVMIIGLLRAISDLGDQPKDSKK